MARNRRWVEQRSWVKNHRWKAVLSRTRSVSTEVPEVVARLAERYGWDLFVYAAMIGADTFASEAADRWVDQRSRRQGEDYYAFADLQMDLERVRRSLSHLPRPVADWFHRKNQVVASMDQLNPRQAYEAMVLFLDQYWQRVRSDDVGALLGQISLDIWADGIPGDPASWGDWVHCVKHVLEKGKQ